MMLIPMNKLYLKMCLILDYLFVVLPKTSIFSLCFPCKSGFGSMYDPESSTFACLFSPYLMFIWLGLDYFFN